MRFAIVSACWRLRRPSSAPVARMRASKPWRDEPMSASVRYTATSQLAKPCSRRSIAREVEQLGELAQQLKSEAAPVDALRRWLRSNVEFVATKKGMSAALALAVHGSSELYAYTFDRLTKAVGALLDRAVAAGEIRPDIGPEDLLRALAGMCYMHDSLVGKRPSCAWRTSSSMACACVPASTAKPRGCRRRRRHRERLRRDLPNTDPGSAALKPAVMARPRVGSTPEAATTAAGSAWRLLYKYERLLTVLGPVTA
jgi:hypothetical protein